MPFDLFGEIPVTWDEVHTWCEKVAGMTGWRRDWYIRHWNIIEKVRRAKADGSFYETIAAINSPHAAAIYPYTHKQSAAYFAAVSDPENDDCPASSFCTLRTPPEP